MITSEQLAAEIADLYARPLDAFVSSRDDLASRLRDAGDREGATTVKALRKPSVPAWAINRLARTVGDQLTALFAIGEQLHAAQRALLAGEADPDDTRRIATEERAAVHTLVERAAAILTEAGIEPSASYRERIADTLYATASDPTVREQVTAGRLVKEARRVGFGLADTALQVIPGGRDQAGGEQRREQDRRRRRREQLAQKIAMLEEDAVRAARATQDAERDLVTAERSREEAARAVARARKAATAADQRLADARARQADEEGAERR